MFTVKNRMAGLKKICTERRNKRRREIIEKIRKIAGERKLCDLTEHSGERDWRNNENRGNEMGWDLEKNYRDSE